MGSFVCSFLALALTTGPARTGPVVNFYHIPKNGGSVLREALHAAGATMVGLELSGRAPSISYTHSPRKIKRGPVGVGCYPGHTPHAHVVMNSGSRRTWNGMDPSRRRSFAVLRHPYERAVSQWTWGFQSMWRPQLQYTKQEMNRFIQDAIANVSRPEITSDTELTLSGSYWHNTRRGPYHQDCHWIPQVNYIFSGHQRVVDRYFCLGLDHDIPAQLSAWTGLTVNGAAPRRRSNESQPVVTTISDLRRSGQCSRARHCREYAALSDETLAALNSHYTADFSVFGFSRAATASEIRVHAQGQRISLSLPGAPQGCNSDI
jgi:hypothetical protein